jgi:hypothetical protein
MFQVYCPHHQADVLLSFGNIISIVNRPDGIEMLWRCWCGEEGRQEMSRPKVPRLDVPRLDVTA